MPTRAKEHQEQSPQPEFELPDLEEIGDRHGSAIDEEADFQPQKSQRRIPFLAIGGLTMLAIGLTFGWRWWQFQQVHISTDNAQIQGHLSPISSKIPATIQQVLVKTGERVQAGQTLVILEDPDLELKVSSAAAALASAQAQIASAADTIRLTRQTNQTQIQQAQAKLTASRFAIEAARAGVAQAQVQIATKQTAITQAQTEVNKTQADYQRYRSLHQAGAVSAQQFDAARADYDKARSSLKEKNIKFSQIK